MCSKVRSAMPKIDFFFFFMFASMWRTLESWRYCHWTLHVRYAVCLLLFDITQHCIAYAQFFFYSSFKRCDKKKREKERGEEPPPRDNNNENRENIIRCVCVCARGHGLNEWIRLLCSTACNWCKREWAMRRASTYAIVKLRVKWMCVVIRKLYTSSFHRIEYLHESIFCTSAAHVDRFQWQIREFKWLL